MMTFTVIHHSLNVMRFSKGIGHVLLLAWLLNHQMVTLAQSNSALSINGDLIRTQTLNMNEVAALRHTEIIESKGISTPEHQQSTQLKFQGVLLRDILKHAGFQEKERYDFRKSIVVARATDGYVALFTWAELFNTKLGDSILVVTSVNGKPLPDSEGPFAIRSFGDTKPGPRHVKWLREITVKKVAP